LTPEERLNVPVDQALRAWGVGRVHVEKPVTVSAARMAISASL